MKLRLFVVLSCAYLLLASREQPWGDAHVVYDTTQNMVDHFGKADPPKKGVPPRTLLERAFDRLHIEVNLGGPPQFYAIRNGKKYGVFPMGNVVAMVPSYLAFRALRAIPHKPLVDELLFRYTSHLSPSLLIAGVCVLFFAMARREGASERAAMWMTLLLGFATILFIYARVPFSEALQMLLLTWTVERGLVLGDRLSRRGAFFAGLACGLLFNTKLIYALVIPVVLVYVVVQNRKQPRALVEALVVAAVPLVALGLFAIAHNYVKTGTLADSGYRIPEGVFSGDAYAALWGYFFSTGKSVFLYTPALVLGALALPSYLRERRAHAIFLIAVSVVVTLANAKFRYWHADYCWGPRLLVPLTAVWMLPAATWIEGALLRGRRRLRALGLGALVGAGIWVQVLGASFYWDHYIRIAIAVKDQTGAPGWYTEDLHHCHFIPQFSPLVGHAWLLRHVLHDDANLLADAPWKRVVPGPVNLYGEWTGLKFDWWLLDWGRIKEARVWAALIVLVLVGLGAWAAAGLGDGRPRRARPEKSRRVGAIQ